MAEKRSDVFRENPIFLTTRAALALAARCRRALKEKGLSDLSPAQVAILASLVERDGQTPSELARTAHYEKSTLTPMVEKLEQAALIARARDPKDGRLQRLYLTKKGRKRFKDADAVLTEVTRALLADLPRKTLKHHLAFCEAVLEGEAERE